MIVWPRNHQATSAVNRILNTYEEIKGLRRSEPMPPPAVAQAIAQETAPMAPDMATTDSNMLEAAIAKPAPAMTPPPLTPEGNIAAGLATGTGTLLEQA